MDVTEHIPVDYQNLSWTTTTRYQNRFFRALLAGRLPPARQPAEMKRTVRVSADGPAALARRSPLVADVVRGLGLVERPLTCRDTYWSHEGGDGGYITLNGVTEGGGRSAVVSMSEARGDTFEHIKEQEEEASALIDHALCAGGSGIP